MFVPHEPEFCFDVTKYGDRCVCGCSAIVTSHEGVDRGYCERCAALRRTFVDKMVGSIYLDENDGLSSSLINVIENIRKSYFAERFYYMIDCYFAKHQNDKSLSPYMDDDFRAKIYREKYVMMNNFTANLPSIINTSRKDKNIIKIYHYYLSELKKMAEKDDDVLGELTAKLGGYTYRK